LNTSVTKDNVKLGSYLRLKDEFRGIPKNNFPVCLFINMIYHDSVSGLSERREHDHVYFHELKYYNLVEHYESVPMQLHGILFNGKIYVEIVSTHEKFRELGVYVPC